jgi:hypothetical protein
MQAAKADREDNRASGGIVSGRQSLGHHGGHMSEQSALQIETQLEGRRCLVTYG